MIQSVLVKAMESAVLATPVGILSFFAVVWLSVGLVSAGQVSVAAIAAGATVSAALVWAATRADRAYTGPMLPDAAQKRIGRLVGWASATEGVAILIAVNVLINIGLGAYQLCAIAVIVGLHFIPLARLPFAGVYYVTAAAMVALGGLGCLLGEAVRPLAVGAGCAAILWLTAAWILGGRQKLAAA